MYLTEQNHLSMNWTNLHEWRKVNYCILPNNAHEHVNLPNSAETQVDNKNKTSERITSNEPTNILIEDNEFIPSQDENNQETSNVNTTFTKNNSNDSVMLWCKR